MGFRENLKAELTYSGMFVKELADRTGLKKRTIDQYLSVRDRMPAADAAIKIARVLGVSVEYLITGSDAGINAQLDGLSPEIRLMARIAEQLNPDYRKIALSVVQTLQKHDRNTQLKRTATSDTKEDAPNPMLSHKPNSCNGMKAGRDRDGQTIKNPAAKQ